MFLDHPTLTATDGHPRPGQQGRRRRLEHEY